MAIDGVMLTALVKELSRAVGGRILKIYQPFTRDIVLHIRTQGRTEKLLLSADPTHPRVYFTTEQVANPEQPPLFCMVLRKHLEGGVIEAIQQPSTERIIWIDVRSHNEMGSLVKKRLIIEVMGRHSNIILLNLDNGKIVDSIYHVTAEINQYRLILPGEEYVTPPDQGKLSPFSVDQITFVKKLDFNQGRLDRQIVQHFMGISPLLAKEIVYRAGLTQRERLWNSFKNTIDQVATGPYQPTIIHAKKNSAFYLFPLTHLEGEQEQFSSISAMLDHYFREKAHQQRFNQVAGHLGRHLKNLLSKNKKKINVLTNTMEESKEAETYRLFGELLTAHLYLVKPGDKQIEVTNYYDESQSPLLIPLQPELSPSENAQRFFKKYNKLKVAQQKAQEQLDQTKQEIEYLETVSYQLEQAALSEIEEIREELIEQGYLRPPKKNSKKRKKLLPQPKQFYSSDGTLLLVGGNNKQNDYLTMKLAAPHDTWLHAKEIPGAHVVIRSKHVTQSTLLEAAALAAYFSKARFSSQVPIDYTLVKHVRKPKGTKPGFVIYEQHKTVYVTPDEKLITKLQKQSPEASNQNKFTWPGKR